MAKAPLDEIINALAYATRPRAWKVGDIYQRTRRPALSSGALHPISVLLISIHAMGDLLRYDASQHSLDELRAERDPIITLSQRASKLIPDANGTVVAFIGDLGRIGSHYNNSLSLMWRDAGALLQTIALVCEAFELAFCPLGLLGGEVVDALGAKSLLIPAGLAILGHSRNSK